MAIEQKNDENLNVYGGYKVKSWRYRCDLCGHWWEKSNKWYAKPINPKDKAICPVCMTKTTPSGAVFGNGVYKSIGDLRRRNDWSSWNR